VRPPPDQEQGCSCLHLCQASRTVTDFALSRFQLLARLLALTQNCMFGVCEQACAHLQREILRGPMRGVEEVKQRYVPVFWCSFTACSMNTHMYGATTASVVLPRESLPQSCTCMKHAEAISDVHLKFASACEANEFYTQTPCNLARSLQHATHT